MPKKPITGAKFPTICFGCGKEFIVRRCRFIQAKAAGINLYCTRKCFCYNSTTAGGGLRKSRYQDNYYCRQCGAYFPKEKAKMYIAKTGKNNITYPTCSNPECRRVRVMLKPRHPKYKKRFRETVIEEQQEKKPITMLTVEVAKR